MLRLVLTHHLTGSNPSDGFIKLFFPPTSSEMRFLSCLLGQCNRNQICQELPHNKGKCGEYIRKITSEAMNVGSNTAMPSALAQLIL